MKLTTSQQCFVQRSTSVRINRLLLVGQNRAVSDNLQVWRVPNVCSYLLSFRRTILCRTIRLHLDTPDTHLSRWVIVCESEISCRPAMSFENVSEAAEADDVFCCNAGDRETTFFLRGSERDGDSLANTAPHLRKLRWAVGQPASFYRDRFLLVHWCDKRRGGEYHNLSSIKDTDSSHIAGQVESMLLIIKSGIRQKTNENNTR